MFAFSALQSRRAAGKAAVDGVRCDDAQLFHEIF